MSRHPYPPSKIKKPYPYWLPIWFCVTCKTLGPRIQVAKHVLRKGHSCVPAL